MTVKWKYYLLTILHGVGWVIDIPTHWYCRMPMSVSRYLKLVMYKLCTTKWFWSKTIIVLLHNFQYVEFLKNISNLHSLFNDDLRSTIKFIIYHFFWRMTFKFCYYVSNLLFFINAEPVSVIIAICQHFYFIKFLFDFLYFWFMKLVCMQITSYSHNQLINKNCQYFHHFYAMEWTGITI